jgi:dihydroorotate dehydrogenase
MDPERAHEVALWALSSGLVSWWSRLGAYFGVASRPTPAAERHLREVLTSSCWGRTFSSPIGLAAGFDKDGVAVDALFELGFGFVEIGSVTPRPQAGNPRPRLFRLEADNAVINRMGFNSAGCETVQVHLRRWQERGHQSESSLVHQDQNEAKVNSKRLGINIGKNRETRDEDAVIDYAQVLQTLGPFADYLVVNVSSPNTPGLRLLQGRERLRALLRQLKQERDELQEGHARPPLLVKVSPDLSDEEIRDIADVVLEEGIDGIVVSNTTVQRPPSLRSPATLVQEHGGLSGAPLRDLSNRVLSRFYRHTRGRVPLIGVGGVFSGADAYAKIRAGASLVQLYTALTYEGPFALPRLERELAYCLKRDGYQNVAEAIGADHR